MNEALETALDALSGAALPEAGQIGRAWLIVRHPDREQPELVELALEREVVIGRLGSHAQVVVEGSKVSRKHALVAHRGEYVEVRDLGSLNGTQVGGSVLRSGSARLRGGEQLRIGESEILLAVTRTSRRAASDAAASNLPNDGIVLAEPSMQQVFMLLQRLAPLKTSVLIEGESGVGKQVIAEHLHQLGPRASAPFIHVNCASLPESLAESALFGHERGAFTGADRRKHGYFEAASGGTLFLDEIAELPLALQSKLLVVLEQSTVTRVGSTEAVRIDVRIACATHQDLSARVKRGEFREDLWFRLSAFALKIPPLRERPRELMLLAELFLRDIAATAAQPAPRLTEEARRALQRYHWPGNVRELRNTMEFAFVMAAGADVLEQHLPSRRVASGPVELAATSAPDAPLPTRLDELERRELSAAMAAEAGNQTRAARRLGISRRALIHKLDKFCMSRRFGADRSD